MTRQRPSRSTVTCQWMLSADCESRTSNRCNDRLWYLFMAKCDRFRDYFYCNKNKAICGNIKFIVEIVSPIISLVISENNVILNIYIRYWRYIRDWRYIKISHWRHLQDIPKRYLKVVWKDFVEDVFVAWFLIDIFRRLKDILKDVFKIFAIDYNWFVIWKLSKRYKKILFRRR